MATSEIIPNRTIVLAYQQIGGTADLPKFESTNAVFVIEHDGLEPDWDQVVARANESFVMWDMIEAITPVANWDRHRRHFPIGYGATALQILNPNLRSAIDQ